ncbi:MAG: BatD family protein [Candidatus Zixiibacteriota bacterium]
MSSIERHGDLPPVPILARVGRTITLACVLLAFSLAAAFADTTFRLKVEPKKIMLSENATLQLTLESDSRSLPQPQLPPLPDFQVFSSGRNQSMQVTNGRVRSSIIYSYVLSPRHAGRFTVGPARVTVDGVEYTTQAETVVVNEAPPASPAPVPAPPEHPRNEVSAAREAKRKVFITAALDKDTAYVNEPVTYIFRFYKGEPLLSSPEYSRPAFANFWFQDLPPQRQYTTVVDGVPYEVTEIRTALFPTDAGEKTIGPSEVKATVIGRRRAAPRDPFSLFDNDYFGAFNRGEELKLTTTSLRLFVRPLPESGKPREASGLVGRFAVEARADVHSVNVGDPITVKVTVSGEGNIKSIPEPHFDSLPNFRIFSGGTSEDISTTDYRVSGRKTFEEVFVPQRPGSYRLPPFAVTYFDVARRSYQTVRSDSIPVTVTGAAADFTIPSLRLGADQLSDLAADVRFLKTEGGHFRQRSDPGLFGGAFWIGHILPLAGLTLLLGWRRRLLREAADPVGRRRRLAYRLAMARMQERASSDKPSAGLSAETIAEALLQYYSDRYNCAAQGLRRDEMRGQLLDDGLPEGTVNEYLDILQSCDQQRYAPGQDHRASADLPARAARVLVSLEKPR